MLRALTLDYWDTIYLGAPEPTRKARRKAAILRMIRSFGVDLSSEQFDQVYRASAIEADRWWREEHRGYTTADRIRWMLVQLAIERPEDCRHVAAASEAVDDTLLDIPPPLLPGAAEAVRALSARYTLAIVSDTGFASGRAQNRVLERDGILSCFAATIYSMEVGHTKPRAEPFLAAIQSLGVSPSETLHIGDNERTDVGGALATGLRAIRLDVVRDNGPTRAEYVARSLEDLVMYFG